MSKELKEVKRLILERTAGHPVDISLINGGRHNLFCVRHLESGRVVKVPVTRGTTGLSSWRRQRNLRSDLKKLLREIGI